VALSPRAAAKRDWKAHDMVRRRIAPQPTSKLAIWARRIALFSLAATLVAVIVVRSGALDIVPALSTLAGGLALAIVAILLAFGAGIIIWREGIGGVREAITALLIGMAIGDGAIKSVDDTAETYVPGLKGTEYGATPLRALLHMSSGVDFGEERDQGRDLDRLWIDMVRGTGSKGTVASIAQFNRRIAPPGTRFYYASIEPDVLGLVFHYAVKRSASDYLREKIWQPIGAEADARWLIDAEGLEVAHHGFNAVLRDYARLGRLLAHDGAWDGKQLIPAQWMWETTTTRPSEAYLAPGRTEPRALGYGYLMWLLPGTRRQFAPIGFLGQRILVDPASKLIMVQTAVENSNEIGPLWSDVVKTFGG